MNYNALNELIQYIESNLTEKIDYKKLSRITGVSEYSLQRIFVFMTEMSLSEYIRKRRLSKAFEELKNTDIKIIDLATKYQYESSISFSRAFKNTFGITPSECRNGESSYKQYPIIKFSSDNLCKELDYEIKNIDELKIYCIKIQAIDYEDYLFHIRQLYREIERNGLHDKFNKVGMYGISIYKNNTYFYYVGSKNKYDGTEDFTIPKGKYAIFSIGSREQKDIVKTEKNIYTQWLQSTNYDIDNNFNFELYTKDNCYLYIKIKDKQN